MLLRALGVCLVLKYNTGPVYPVLGQLNLIVLSTWQVRCGMQGTSDDAKDKVGLHESFTLESD